ncbi:helix-turn-helix domain-containing protein [Marinobacter qingdaonensis]|uniref:Helix-turn-helix domain-containing protein n=1 Tax=Marinobacter qingdaonensis TaxID=3108486 RepID=A0ABU5NTC7_9GAMM|nr:helix-turn-helix domain-containing protein [Marinobacter sp. ASW11-75]MEA1079066.1 helix-turn-helix domain-containing protein [Marinobacter sp. ASW11-75]
MRWEELDQEPCSVARTLSVIGDRWTLIVLRDCFLGVRRFEHFEKRLGITRHVLTDRLKKLVQNEVLVKVPYQDKPLREEYRLTEKGLALHPVIMSLVHWGNTYMADERGAPLVHIHKDCGHQMAPVTTCSHCGESVSARDVRVEVGTGWSSDRDQQDPEAPTRNAGLPR